MKNLLLIILIALGSTAFSQSVSYVHVDQEANPTNLKVVTDAMSYPENLAIQGEEGTVVFRVLVDKNGNYKQHAVINSDNPQFTASAEQQLRKLTFTPAYQNNEAVTSWVFVPVKFRLADSYAVR